MMEPTRMVLEKDGIFLVTVQAPAFMRTAPHVVKLTAEQYERYKFWREGRALIQAALPDLTAEQREILMTGLDDTEFDAACGDEE